MPAKTSQNEILAKLKKMSKSYDEHKEDTTDYGMSEQLPPGINGGVAQVQSCKVDVIQRGDMKGELYLQIMARVVEPETIINPDTNKLERVKGRLTRVWVPLCQSRTKTESENVARALNELRKLGVDTTSCGAEDLVTICEAVEDSKPYTRFRTWRGNPTPQFPTPSTQEDWRGVIDGYEPEVDGQPAVVDETIVEGQDDAVGDGLLDTAKRADDGDGDAQDTLSSMARDAGHSDEDISNAASWVDVVKLIDNPPKQRVAKLVKETADDYATLGADADEGDESAVEVLQEAAENAGITKRADFDSLSWSDVAELLQNGEAWEPKAEEVYKYKPEGARKAVDCDVLKVDRNLKTVDLRNLDTEDEYHGVNWSELGND